MHYIESLENLKIKEICGGCRYLTSYLDCHINKEDYRDYEKTICKFYEKRILSICPGTEKIDGVELLQLQK